MLLNDKDIFRLANAMLLTDKDTGIQEKSVNQVGTSLSNLLRAVRSRNEETNPPNNACSIDKPDTYPHVNPF